MCKIMNFKYISLIAIAASLIGCTKNGEMDEDFLTDGPAFSADFLQQSVQTKVTHTDDGNALKLATKSESGQRLKARPSSPTVNILLIRAGPKRHSHIGHVHRGSAGQEMIFLSPSMPAIHTMRTGEQTLIK